jgi:hypothetical protein
MAWPQRYDPRAGGRATVWPNGCPKPDCRTAPTNASAAHDSSPLANHPSNVPEARPRCRKKTQPWPRRRSRRPPGRAALASHNRAKAQPCTRTRSCERPERRSVQGRVSWRVAGRVRRSTMRSPCGKGRRPGRRDVGAGAEGDATAPLPGRHSTVAPCRRPPSRSPVRTPHPLAPPSGPASMRVLSSAVLVVVCLLSGAESGLVWDDKK